MMKLLRVELRRYRVRRLMRILTLITGLAIAFFAVLAVLRKDFNYFELPGILLAMSFPLLMLTWLFGASFIGAEWHHRSVTTTLTWEPRRIRVLLIKAAAVVVSGFLFAFLIQAFFALAFYPAATVGGGFQGIDSRWVRDTVEVSLRVAAIASVAGLIGFSLATVGRNTAAALGAGFAYILIIENLIRAFKPLWSEWFLGDNLILVLGGPASSPLARSMTEGTLVLTAYLVVLLGGAVLAFNWRDVA